MKEMRNEYPSDITREQFEKIRGDLEGARKTTHPRKYDLYEVHDFPDWRVVRYYYDIWSKPDDDGISLLDRILRKLVEMERKNNDRSEKTTMIIVDSKSIQNADTAQCKGYDAGKKLQE